MTWVKVCGLTRERDVTVAVDAGADALGFVLMESPRQVTIEQAAWLIAGVPVRTYLLMSELSPFRVLEALRRTGATGIQPYRTPSVARICSKSGYHVLRPTHAKAKMSISTIPDDQMLLIDAPHKKLEGGTGRTFDWSLTDQIERDFVLAGGLGPHNVAEAVVMVGPWGVDASSRLESAPGEKDPGKVLAYVEEAKRL